MLALIFGVLFAVSFLGFAITSRTKYSAASHLFWGVAFIIFTSRVVVIKSQLGQPIVAYSGDEVYWKIPKDLPKMTKLMIDGKALYIHRANFQIIDTALLD